MDKTVLASMPDEVTNYISSLEAQIARLEELLRSANKALYGRSSEKTRYILGNPDQMSFFNEAETYADEAAPEETITVSYTRKKKRTKEQLAKELPVQEIVMELPENERVCGICENGLHPIGKTLVRRELNFIPAKAFVAEIYQM